MSTAITAAGPQESWYHRLPRTAPARIAIGAIATVAPVALSMGTIQALIEKPYRQLWPFMLATLLCIWAYRAVVKALERRTVDELAPRPAARESCIGAMTGIAMVSGVASVLWCAGALRIEGLGGGGLLAPLAEMALASVLEEVLFRGVLLRILVGWLGMWPALALSSLLFGLAHLPADGFSATAFAGIVLAGALLSAAYLLHGRLWLPIGLHFGWNFTTTAVFGLASSGGKASGYFKTVIVGPEWLTGGSFGIEASVLTLVVTAAGAATLLALRHRRDAEGQA